MPVLFTTRGFVDRHGGELDRIARATGEAIEPVLVPDEGYVDEETLARLEVGWLDQYYPADRELSRRFLGAAQRAPNLRWVHLPHAGIDAPVFGQLLERGVRLTNSSGSSAAPIAQTMLAALLMLQRGFPRWLDAQRRHAWEPTPFEEYPPDVDGQTLLVFGLGAIGNELARLAQALGMRVLGVRRSAQREDDCCDELHPPEALPELLPRAQWLAVTSPLTDATRGAIDAEVLARLPRGARVMNVGRGPIIDEAALIEALRSGHLGGAYLDVFEQEPLPPDSPLWDMPDVIVTPHSSAASTGNLERATAIFLRNLERYCRGEALENEVFER